MKKQTGIWVDSSKAVIVTLTNGSTDLTVIESEIENRIHHEKEGDKGTFVGGHHHVNNERKFEERKKHQVDQFLEKITEQIKNEDEYYVFGPAEMKLNLGKKIEADHLIAFKLKSVDTADHMSHNEITAHVKAFFNEHDKQSSGK